MSEHTMQGPTTEQVSLQELQDENKLLLEQLFQVQEGLERYHLRNLELESRSGRTPVVSPSPGSWVDDELPTLLAENQRLQALADARQKIQAIESEHGLHARLGALLVQAADESGTLWKAPARLLAFWRRESQSTPPGALGGKDFSKVKAVYAEGGLEAVRQLLDKQSLSAALKGNAYTALARELMYRDTAVTAVLAWQAYTVDPKFFRLKWLAFRLHDAGSIIESEALLDLLPKDTNFSDSEANQVYRLRREAKRERVRLAKQETQFAERRVAREQALLALQQTVAQLESEKDQLSSDKVQLSSDKDSLVLQLADARANSARQAEEQSQVLAQHMQALNTLQQRVAQLESEKDQLSFDKDSLTRQLADAGADSARQAEEQSQLFAQHTQALNTLQHTMAWLDAENARLLSDNDSLTRQLADAGADSARQAEEQSQVLAQHMQALNTLQQRVAQLESEKDQLSFDKDSLTRQLADARADRTRQAEEQSQLFAQHTQALNTLQHTMAWLDAENARLLSDNDSLTRQLADARADRTRQAEEHSRIFTQHMQALNTLQQTVARLESEKAQLSNEALVEYIDKRIEKIQQLQKENIQNSTKQIEACVRLQHYLGADAILPDTHNWPISPDFGVLLVNLVEQNGYQGVIEFGSGTSTLIVAKALERVAHRAGDPPVPLLSFDHLKEYKDKTLRLIHQAGLAAHANVVLAPLSTWGDAAGKQFSYYECDEALQLFKQKLPASACRLLVIVDGPPASTCKHARYPALPRVLENLGKEYSIDFLLDDYLRSEEQEVAAQWLDILSALELQHTHTEFNNLEKKACLIEVRPSQKEKSK